MKNKPENILIIIAVVGVVLFYSVLGGFQRLSKEKQESVS